MPNYILKLILKNPETRTLTEEVTLLSWQESVRRCNENPAREISYYQLLENMFNKGSKTIIYN